MLSQILPRGWTITHGFYALMGGFVFDFDESFPAERHPFVKDVERLSLTPKGIMLLAQCNRVPYISQQEIEDKSKQDEIGKILACIQASWLILQVITRLAVDLPVTLLEVSVVNHVICALVLFAMWWHKPRRVEEPTVLKGNWTGPLAAFMMMSSNVGQGQMLPGWRVEGETSEIARLKFFPPPKDEKVVAMSGKQVPSASVEPCENARPLGIRAKSGLPKLCNSDVDLDRGDEDDDEQTALTRRRWKLARDAIQQYPAVKQLLRPPFTDANRVYETALAAFPEMPAKCRRASIDEKIAESPVPWLECSSQFFVTEVASNWPYEGMVKPTSGLRMGVTLWVTSIAFTAVYISAWFANFPSLLERWLWRSSACYIAFSGLLWASMHAMAEMSVGLWWTWYHVQYGDASKRIKVSLIVSCSICGAMYVFARVFLIVEAFISLRSLPFAAYITPQWTLSFPHIG